jgi:hypothetical protein
MHDVAGPGEVANHGRRRIGGDSQGRCDSGSRALIFLLTTLSATPCILLDTLSDIFVRQRKYDLGPDTVSQSPRRLTTTSTFART